MSKNFKKKDSFSSKDQKKDSKSFNSKSSADKKFSKESFNKKSFYGSKDRDNSEAGKENYKSSDKKSYNDYKKAGSFKKKNEEGGKSEFRERKFNDKKGDYQGSPKDFKRKPSEGFNRKEDSFGSKPDYKKKDFSDKKDSFKKAFKDKPAGRFNRKDAAENKPDFRKKKYSDKKKNGEKKTFNRDSKPGFGKKKEFTNPYHKGDKNADQPKYNLKKPRFIAKREEPSEPGDGTIRLNKYISNAGICSRRDADKMIADGMIKVNGKVITEMGYKVNDNDIVSYGKRKLNKERPVYVLLNKPKDFITTTDDPEERRTVMDLVASACKERIYPVGRLDRNTTGLLLLTNDGELAEKLTHPSNEVKKVYQVDLDKPLTREDIQKITTGLQLEDGPVRVDDIAVLNGDSSSLGIEIHEGRNRIVRRIFEHLGYQVVKLDRVMYAGLDKKDLPRGKWRYLSEKEVIRLKYFM